ADALIERLFGYAIGKPLSALIEDDYPGKCSQSLQQVLLDRSLPREFHVRQCPRNKHHVIGAVAKNPIGDMNVSTFGIFNICFHAVTPPSRYTRVYFDN